MSYLKQETKKQAQLQKDLLRDFDILAEETDQQEKLYQPADFQKAVKMTQNNLVVDSNGNKYSIFCDISEFKKYGVGIYLLFKFLKWATVVLFVCSILSSINMMVILVNNHLEEHGISGGSNLQATLVKTTIANLAYEKYNSVIAVDFLITIILTVSLIFWKERETFYIVQCSHFFVLSSYSTVILENIPSQYNENQMQKFLGENYGAVKQIFTVKDFGDDIYDYKELTDIVEDYKEELALVKMNEERTSKDLTKLFFEFRDKYMKIKEKIKKKKENGDGYYRPIFAFISFYQIQARQHLLNDFNPYCYSNLYKGLQEWRSAKFSQIISKKKIKLQKKNTTEKIDKELDDKKPEENKGTIIQQNPMVPLFKGQQLQFGECFMQPNSILWENLSISSFNRFLRMVGQVTILLGVLFITIIVIFMLAVFENTLYDSSYKNMNREEILKTNNKDAILSFCLNLSTTQFFYDQYELCLQYSDKYVKLTILVLVIPIIVSLLKFILTEAMKATVTFRRFRYQVYRVESQMLIVFAIYFFAAGLLEIFLSLKIVFQGSGFTLSFVDIIFPITKELFSIIQISISNTVLFQDFTRSWYNKIAGRIILIGIMSFSISAISKIAYQWMRSVFFNFIAKKQKIQLKMNYWLSGDFLQLQYIYAMGITIFYFTLFFCGPMPITFISGALSMLLLYWSTKICFVRYCAKPMLYNHKINSLVVNILFIGILLHCFMTPIFFGVAIGKENEGFNFKEQKQRQTYKTVNIMWRLLAYWYYFIVAGVILIYLVLRKVLNILWLKLASKITSMSIFQNPTMNAKSIKEISQKVSYISKEIQNINQGEIKIKEIQNIEINMADPLRLGVNQQRKKSKKFQRVKFSLPSQLCIVVTDLSNQQRYSMHQHKEYKNILKTLYTVDYRQRCRKTFFFDEKLGNIISGKGEDKNYKLFEEMIQLVNKDSQKYKPKRIKSNSKEIEEDSIFNPRKKEIITNPFEKNKKKLEQIYRNSTNGELLDKKTQLVQFLKKLTEQSQIKQTQVQGKRSTQLQSKIAIPYTTAEIGAVAMAPDFIKEKQEDKNIDEKEEGYEAPRSDQRIATFYKQDI